MKHRPRLRHGASDDANDRASRLSQVLGDEQKRISLVMGLAAVPHDCGPEIPVAPARGVFRKVHTRAMYPSGKDGYVLKDAGHMGRATMVVADIFDVMAAQAARRRAPAPFRPDQVEMARRYRNLVEKHNASGVGCSSVEAVRGGGSSGGTSFMDALLSDAHRIRVWRARVGTGAALAVRRIRPSDRGTRRTILDIDMVDMVCIEDCSLDKVLARHGWCINGKTRAALREAMSGALDRMLGPVRAARLCRSGALPEAPWPEK